MCPASTAPGIEVTAAEMPGSQNARPLQTSTAGAAQSCVPVRGSSA
jgi:hypothetical protein